MNHFDHFLSAQFGSIKFLTLLYSHYHHLFPELYSPCKAETLSALIPQCLPPNLHQPADQAARPRLHQPKDSNSPSLSEHLPSPQFYARRCSRLRGQTLHRAVG